MMEERGKRYATRESFGMALVELGREEPRLVVLDADLSKATKTDLFHQAFPARFVECGISECNMIGVAAGLASCGKIPVAASFAMFSAGRAFEQVRNSVAYPRLNVKIIGSHAGVSVGEDGATHQALEDVALMRSLPGMTVLCPCDHVETLAAARAAIAHEGPVYIRLGRHPVNNVNDPEGYRFELGKGIVLRQGTDAAIFAAGPMVSEALQAADLLSREQIEAAVVNLHTIKPIDRELIVHLARRTGAVVTAEDHSVIGGLGDAVGAVLLEECPVPLEKVGVQDRFGFSGKGDELLNLFGLRAENIAAAARKALARKRSAGTGGK